MLDTEISTFFIPDGKIKGLVSIPHSGEFIPEEFKKYLTEDLRLLAEDVDYKVNELVDINELNNNNIAVLVSNVHRTCVDLNRSEDLAIIAWKKNSKGHVLEVNEFDKDFQEAMLTKYHRPYFYKIKSTVDNLFIDQKRPVIIDLHSMPSRPTEYHLKVTPDQPKIRPDFCVSDISGVSCSKDFIDHMCEELGSFSKNVTQNIPYYGGHITRHIQANFPDSQNIQIEISRGIYMDEDKKELKDELVKELKPKLTRAIINQFSKFIL